MTACTSSTVLLKPDIQANLKQPCPDLNELESGQGKAVLLWSVDTVAKYNECKARHVALVKALE
ncbi:hypothetical protein BEN76_03165 [Acinetobacter soli]|uniref:Uncharacterized protein n=1 Tax=Acinetobacter soli TaxID=487316 RepID=A0A1P8EMM9_9GAMM|nr:hypothetical protein [Acinetobacter soli]APV37490.1 hypothetical protein BEN76_03165 [Acinetobacter soli]